MLKEGHTLHLDGPIPPALISIFPYGIDIDASTYTRRGVDIPFGPIVGGDDVFDEGGAYMS